jgi:hypothetical protein
MKTSTNTAPGEKKVQCSRYHISQEYFGHDHLPEAVGYDELNAYGGVRRIYERYDPHISCRRYGRVFVRDEERVGD